MRKSWFSDEQIFGIVNERQRGAAFCLEYGVAIRQGAGIFRLDLPRVLADETNDLTPAMRRMLAEFFEDLARIDQRIAQTTREIEGLAARDDRARRLMSIPGIGPLAATALLAAVGGGRAESEVQEVMTKQSIGAA